MFSEFRKSLKLGKSYAKTVAFTIINYAAALLLIRLFSVYSQKKVGADWLMAAEQLKLLSQDQLRNIMLSVMGFGFLMVIIWVSLYATLTYLIYLTITKNRYSLKTCFKFFLSIIIWAFIFLIPFAFAIKLSAESVLTIKFAGTILFLIFLLVYFHFTNLGYLFLASEKKLWKSIGKAFSESADYRKFLVPYAMAIVMVGAITMIGFVTSLLPDSASTFISFILAALFINWLRFFVSKKVNKKWAT